MKKRLGRCGGRAFLLLLQPRAGASGLSSASQRFITYGVSCRIRLFQSGRARGEFVEDDKRRASICARRRARALSDGVWNWAENMRVDIPAGRP